MQKQFQSWQLKDNPFLPLPPSTEDLRRRVFVGRETEIELILSRANRAQGLFLFGMFGIGKSILSLEILRQLKQKNKTAYIKYKQNVGLAGSVLLKIQNETSHQLENADAMTQLDRVISSLNLKRPYIVVIDDLDKDSDMSNMQKIIFESRQLIELGFLVILLGHPFGITAELSSSDDILYPIALANLQAKELKEMIEKYLATSRKRSFAGNPLHPFSIEVVNMLTRTISEEQLTPRILNQACRLLLDQAAMDGVAFIEKDYFLAEWEKIAKNCIDSLREEDKLFFRKIREGGILSEDNRPLIKQIGGNFAEFLQVIRIVEHLIQQDILIEDNVNGKKQIKSNPLFGGEIWR